MKEKIDRILCELIDPDVAYEEQSAPLLDSSWHYTNQILTLLKEEIETVENKYQLLVDSVWEIRPSTYDEMTPTDQVRYFGMKEGFEDCRQAILKILES